MLTNRLAQSATNRKMLRQPSLRFAAMTERNWRRTGSRTRAFRESNSWFADKSDAALSVVLSGRSPANFPDVLQTLQRFQIFEQFLLVLVRQLRAVGVTIVAVTFFSRVEKDIRLRQFARRPGRPRWRLSKSDFHGIENIVTAVESLRTFIWRIQQIAQCRHGAVMEVRRTQPDSIQWR